MYWFLSFLIGLNLSFAAEAPFPKNWCSTGRCSSPQEKIWEDFNEGLSPSWDQLPEVISGSCYHSSSHYDNTIEHFSGFIIDVEEDGFSFNGSHSFFAKENPYKGLDVEAARERLKKTSPKRVKIFENYGFYNANPGAERPIRYWFKNGLDGNLKMAVIFGSLKHFILCDLPYHSSKKLIR